MLRSFINNQKVSSRSLNSSQIRSLVRSLNSLNSGINTRQSHDILSLSTRSVTTTTTTTTLRTRRKRVETGWESKEYNRLSKAGNSIRGLHTTSSLSQRDATTGGIPNDGSHSTVYDDFFNLLEGGLPQAVQVKSMSPTSFTLTDGLVISQPCIFLNGSVFLWDPPHLDRMKATPGGAGWEEWNQDVWTLFQISAPKPEILILGTGKTVLPPPAKVKNHLNSLGIQLDVQDSRNACSTFNLLSEEGRRVAVALLPAERSPTKKIQPSA